MATIEELRRQSLARTGRSFTVLPSPNTGIGEYSFRTLPDTVGGEYSFRTLPDAANAGQNVSFQEQYLPNSTAAFRASTPELSPGIVQGPSKGTPTIADVLGRLSKPSPDQPSSGGIGASQIRFVPMPLPEDAVFNPIAIDRNLYALEETAAERQALIDARADLDARARAGAESIVNTWRIAEDNNRLAAEKARVIAQQYGDAASGLWTNAANQAREASVLRAAAMMAQQGRAPIDLDPMAGGGAFIAAMETLARPEAERAFAEGQMQAERSEFMGDLAAAQSAAYQGELKRTSMIMAADMAREHNVRVLERIGRERLALQEAERQSSQFNEQLRAEIESENITRRMQAEQFNAELRARTDQFNAQMRQTAAAAAAKQGTSVDDMLKTIESALTIFGVSFGPDGVGPALASEYTGIPVDVMRKLMRDANIVREENLRAQIGLPPGNTPPLSPGELDLFLEGY
jgi:hypothetical protein